MKNKVPQLSIYHFVIIILIVFLIVFLSQAGLAYLVTNTIFIATRGYSLIKSLLYFFIFGINGLKDCVLYFTKGKSLPTEDISGELFSNLLDYAFAIVGDYFMIAIFCMSIVLLLFILIYKVYTKKHCSKKVSDSSLNSIIDSIKALKENSIDSITSYISKSIIPFKKWFDNKNTDRSIVCCFKDGLEYAIEKIIQKIIEIFYYCIKFPIIYVPTIYFVNLKNIIVNYNSYLLLYEIIIMNKYFPP